MEQIEYNFKTGEITILVAEIFICINLKGCGMSPLFVLVSPCFRENVVVTCKIGSFFCVV